MSAKNRDNKNRWRNITVGFRVSPEENELINKAVALSGLPKQEYCYRRCLNQDVVVQGNPRVFKALKTELAAVLAELKRIEAGNRVDEELLNVIELIAVILGGLEKGEERGWKMKKEKTAPDVSVGADTEQPISKKPTSSISENGGNIKSF